MKIHEFTFIVDADPHKEGIEDIFFEAGCDDATFVLQRGASALCFDREAETYKEAVLTAYENIRSTGSDIIRFEPDYLVSAPEIAERSGLSRSAVDNYAKGQRQEDFPLPDARFSAKSPLWDWVDVSKWLYEHGKIDVSEYQNALVSRVLNISAQVKSVNPDLSFEIMESLESV